MPLLDDYRSGLKPLEVEEWVDLLIYRPLGFLFAWPLKFTPIRPNLITVLSGVVGVAGAVLIGLGSAWGLFWGALLYAYSNVLDCSDGQLARMTGRFSRYGRIYDGVADYVVGLAIFIGIGIGWQPEGMSTLGWWALVFFGGIVSTTHQGMHLNHVRQAYLKAIEATDPNNHVTHKGNKKREKGKRNWKEYFYLPFFYLYRFYLWVEGSVRRQVHLPRHISPEMRENRFLKLILILWTFTGKGSHVTLLTIFMLMGKPEYYLWFCLIPGNFLVQAILLGHKQMLASLIKRERESRTA